MTFVTVYRATNETEAAMVRDFLQHQGIPAKLSSQVPAAVYGLSLQEVEVQVAQDHEPRARELVAAYFTAPDEDFSAEEP